jgi:hypothetical protein
MEYSQWLAVNPDCTSSDNTTVQALSGDWCTLDITIDTLLYSYFIPEVAWHVGYQKGA